jgi:hypothetical protein
MDGPCNTAQSDSGDKTMAMEDENMSGQVD